MRPEPSLLGRLWQWVRGAEMTTPDDAGESIEYELRATLNDGSRLIVGPFRTHAATWERVRTVICAPSGRQDCGQPA